MVIAMAVLGDIMTDMALLDVDFSHLYLGSAVVLYFLISTFLLNENICDSLRKWVECLLRSHHPTTSISYPQPFCFNQHAVSSLNVRYELRMQDAAIELLCVLFIMNGWCCL